ncbi:hypothetical protein GALMADRAFT_1086393 [Galerina marginata CBS 339.88]|uniref:Uncharacterized protein n=1 Tax=Galerina marginata (strain CBS 339.88) TaxID=685588 RepID=A0A067S993_GALM3|nr:hypothetical protein GALMADRAFT_1086393 [Galerina marginata CBS 339.88]
MQTALTLKCPNPDIFWRIFMTITDLDARPDKIQGVHEAGTPTLLIIGGSSEVCRTWRKLTLPSSSLCGLEWTVPERGRALL